METFADYIRTKKTVTFKPVPFKNDHGNMIEWYFKDIDCYADPIYVDGVHVGTIMRCFKTGEVVGVKINLESVK